jgi:hypothetical protein
MWLKFSANTIILYLLVTIDDYAKKTQRSRRDNV